MGVAPPAVGSPRPFLRRRAAAATAVVLAALAAGGVAVSWVPLRSGHSNMVVALLLVGVMTAAGASRRRVAVVSAVVAGAAAFTFFDTEPYERFAISRQPDIATAISLVVVGLITGELAVRVARNRRDEESATGHLHRVRDAAALLADGEELVVLIGAVAEELVDVARLQDCWFTAEPVPAGVPRVGRDGTLEPAAGAATAEIALPVWALGRVVGNFVLVPGAAGAPAPAVLQVAMTLADQAGAALAVQAMPAPVPDGPEPARAVPRLRVLRQP